MLYHQACDQQQLGCQTKQGHDKTHHYRAMIKLDKATLMHETYRFDMMESDDRASCMISRIRTPMAIRLCQLRRGGST
jgi:hypothetical protein